ncbi:MAG: hypothetical protein IJR14_10515 [Synergistaceae bacterium]|nr:hypothetical protein [Synergistaceae bacterium]
MSGPVTTQLFRIEGTVPPPDMLLVGQKGAVHTDIVKVVATGELPRGTLLMPVDGGVWGPCTAAGLEEPRGFAILADSVTIGDDEWAEVAAYFEGDFNEAAVVFPWLEDEADRPAALELAREPLRQCKLFLRTVHE